MWSVNHTSTDWNSALVVFNNVNKSGGIIVNWPNYLSGTKVTNTLDACWYMLFIKLQCTKTSSTDSNFGASFPSLSWPTSFFVFSNNFIISESNNTNL